MNQGQWEKLPAIFIPINTSKDTTVLSCLSQAVGMFVFKAMWHGEERQVALSL